MNTTNEKLRASDIDHDCGALQGDACDCTSMDELELSVLRTEASIKALEDSLEKSAPLFEDEEAEVCDLCEGEGKVERQVLVSGDGAPSYHEGDGTFYPCPECSPVEPADDRDDQLPKADA